MKLTRFTDYGLRVLMVLASRTESLVTIADISQAFDISEAHLMKVTHVLGQTDWVETVRGRNGGMRLTGNPRALKLDTIVRKLEGDFALVECLGESSHNRCVLTGDCALEAALVRATEAFFQELGKVSLADLVSGSPALGKLALWQPLTRRARPSS